MLIPARAQPAVDFAVQVIVGALAFAAVFLTAVALAAFVKFIGSLGFAPAWLVNTATYMEMFIWGADILLFTLFIVVEAWTFGKRLVLGQGHEHG